MLGGLFVALGVGRLTLLGEGRPLVARKLRGFQRVLDAPALFSVAYGEIASSIYFALGIVAAYALGLTPLVLLGAGIFFLIVALSYAEGTAAIPETGGAATFVRRAYNDAWGFVTGWALALDYLIVIALSALFLPHYLGTALSIDGLRETPWDVVVAVCVIAAITGIRLVRHSQLHSRGSSSPASTSRRSCFSSCSGWPSLFSPDALTEGVSVGTAPDVGRPRVRAAARDARVHGPRDGGEPRRRDAESRDGRCRAASSPRSGSSSSSRPRSPSSGSPPSRSRTVARRSARSG